mmetsp:Transcript_51257/g.130260  ORF Transcript_51257/g.130260 Transcript_51257/m.130260 type:complete len:366 (-) Transcript_51257:259-1356(-)
MSPSWPSEVLRLHLILPLLAPHQVQIQLCFVLPHLGLHGRHRAFHHRGASRKGARARGAETGSSLSRTWTCLALHDPFAVVFAVPRHTQARGEMVDGPASAPHGCLGDFLPLRLQHDLHTAIPVPWHRVCDVVLAGHRPLLLHAVAAEGDFRDDFAGRERSGRRGRQVLWPCGAEQGGVDQQRRHRHRGPAREASQDPHRAREHPHSGRGVGGAQAALCSQGRDRLRRRHLEDRPRPLHPPREARQRGPHDHGLPGALRQDPGGRRRLRQEPRALEDLRGGGRQEVPVLDRRQAHVRGADPGAHPVGLADCGLRRASCSTGSLVQLQVCERCGHEVQPQGHRPHLLPRCAGHHAGLPGGDHHPCT